MTSKERTGNQTERRIPEFQSREEEAAFWDTHDVTDYLAELRPVAVQRAGTGENATVSVRKLPDGSFVQILPDGSQRPYVSPHQTDWARIEAMTEEEIEANALADPDNPPLTAEELARMRRPTSPPASPDSH